MSLSSLPLFAQLAEMGQAVGHFLGQALEPGHAIWQAAHLPPEPMFRLRNLPTQKAGL